MKMEIKVIGRSICYSLLFTVLFSLPVMPTSAKTVTYVKEYTYQASEMDSKLSCRTIALEQVKRLLLEELGTYLISETAVKDFELTKDQILSITAGIVMAVILDEKWDGKTYSLKAKISTETDQLVKLMNNIGRDQEQSKTWEEIRNKTEEALKEIEKFKKEIGIGGGEKTTQEKHTKLVHKLNAIDWFKNGYKLRYRDKNNQEAMKAFDKAIELDANLAIAYAGRAAIYDDWGEYQKALRESEQAIQLDPNHAWGFNTRGWANIGLHNFQKAMEDLNRAIELFPKYAYAYANRSRVHHILKNYHRALDDANKAIKCNPELSTGYFRRGRALVSLNKFQDAIRDFDKSIELDPTFSWSFLQRGYTYLKLDKTEQASEDLRKAASLGNKDAQDYLKKKGIRW